MRIAIIGAGTMGRQHARNLGKMPGVTVAGVCDHSLEAAQAAAELCGAPAFNNFDELLAQNPEAVLICLPTLLHKEWTLKAAAAGKHVICEKPIAGNLADAREMIDACRQHGVRLFVGHVVRFFPEYRHMRDRVASGALGKLGVAHTKRVGPHPGKARGWYNDAAQSGGVILDLLIHDIDFIRWTAGDIASVYAIRKQAEGIDYALVTLRFVSGAIANLEGFWGYPGQFKTTAELAGSAGIVRHDSEAAQSLIVRKTAVEGAGAAAVAVPQSPSIHDPYYKEVAHFIDCIRSGEPSLVTAEDAFAALQAALAANESAQTGQPVKLRGGQS